MVANNGHSSEEMRGVEVTPCNPVMNAFLKVAQEQAGSSSGLIHGSLQLYSRIIGSPCAAHRNFGRRIMRLQILSHLRASLVLEDYSRVHDRADQPHGSKTE